VFPGRDAARSAASLNRDRTKLGVRYGPGSAAHRFALRRVRGTRSRAAFFIAGLPTNCRYFSIKVVAARKRIANAERVNSGIPHTPYVFQSRNSCQNKLVTPIMSLDTSTLYLVATLVAALLGIMLLFFGRQERIAALNWWGAAYILGAASVSLWTLASSALGEMFSLALNAFGFIACGMVWNAARVFHGRKPNWPGILLGALAWVAAITTILPDNAALRMTIGAGIVAIYAALTASELWSERRRTLQKRWPAIAVPVLHGFVLMLPILLGDLLRPHDDTFSTSIWVTAFAIERAQDRGVDRSLDRDVQPPRLCGGDRAHDRARSQCRAPGHRDDFRHRSFQVDQRPLRPSGRRRGSKTVRSGRDQHASDHRPVGTDRRRGVRGAAAMFDGRSVDRGRARARSLREQWHRSR
jgi:hypothetical protein